MSETNINTDPTTLVTVAALRIHYPLMYCTVARSLQARLAPAIPEPIMEYLVLVRGLDVVWWSGEGQGRVCPYTFVGF